MDELEFRKRVYANPRDLDQETIDAARANPDYQKILDETLEFEDSMSSAFESTKMSEGMIERLLSIPEEDAPAAESASKPGSSGTKQQNFFQYYAMAASLILAVGIVFSLNNNSGPSSADMIFAGELLGHLYHDSEEIDEITAGATYAVLGLEEINSAMAEAGTRLVSSNDSQNIEIRSAKPCEILPPYESAHLVLQGSQGAISIILINNSPVDVQFNIRDDRFEGVILPMDRGNLILVGEKNEDLSQHASLFADNVEWVI